MFKMAGCGHEHHQTAAPPGDHLGTLYSLYSKIDREKSECLNESVEGSGKLVFKPWDKRLDTSQYVESDSDEELLFNIQFTGSVKLKGMIVIGGEDDFHPSQVKLFKNRPKMGFDDVTLEADQIFDLQPDHEGILEYTTKVARFSNVEHLSLYFPSNFGADSTKIYYIGLKGDYTEAHKHGVTICTYEAKPNPSDHKSKAFNPTSNMVS